MHAPRSPRAAVCSYATAAVAFGLTGLLATPAQAAAVAHATPAQVTPVAQAAPPQAAPAQAHPAIGFTSGVSDSWARQRLAEAGIDVWSSGDCSDRDDPECTSLEGIRSQTIEWTLVLARASGCDLLVTGGTETGHARGTKSHANGYRIDLNASGCLSAYVRRNFTRIGPGLWESPAGNQYLNEGNHWDVTFG